jgi:hypothetical protein
MVAGAVDSVGLAFGWTVFNLVAVFRHGLAVTALLNVAMFCGIALSAPAAARLTRRLDGKRVLQTTAGAEALLRIGSLALLYWGGPLPLTFLLVLVMNVVGWIGFAGMRVEIAAEGADAAGMTRYLALTVALEALGTSLAALLPITSAGAISSTWVGIALLVYALSLLPTAVVAQGSVVGVRHVTASAPVDVRRRRLLIAGALLMVVGSGPTLLFVGLAAELHGHASVAGAAVAFAAGSLLSPAATRLLERHGTSPLRSWPFWCAGMVIGWTAAPWSVAGLWLAQLLSGVCLTGFQGVMDHALAGHAEDGRATTNLAQGSAARAVGSAAAVRLVPVFSAAGSLAAFAGVTALIGLVGGAVLARIVEPAVADDTAVRPDRAPATVA